MGDDGTWGEISSHPAYRAYVIVNTAGIIQISLGQAFSTEIPVQYHIEHRRIGFVDACNIGYRIADPAEDDIVVVLNDDLVFRGPWLEHMVQALDEQPDASVNVVARDLQTAVGQIEALLQNRDDVAKRSLLPLLQLPLNVGGGIRMSQF